LLISSNLTAFHMNWVRCEATVRHGFHHQTRSYPEMVGDMSCVTLNYDLSKISFVYF